MTYDDLMDGRRAQLAREAEAEASRLRREASRAFARCTATASEHRERLTVLSAKRQDEVTLARAIVAALGTDGYEALSYPVEGTR